jgi:hypothetical protein
MTPGTNPRGPDDPFEEALRSLRPRAFSPAARGRTVARLGAPVMSRVASSHGPRVAVALAFLTAAAAIVVAVAIGGWRAERPALSPGRGDSRGPTDVIALAGCECRVRFTHLSGPP